MSFYEQKIAGTKVFSGKVFDVHVDEVVLSDGRGSVREVVEHSGGVCMAAVDDEDNIFFVKQYRYAAGKELLELPAGKLGIGEQPEAAALRELKEETGVICSDIHFVGKFLPTPGYSSEVIYLYYAEIASVGEQSLDEGELLACEKININDAVKMAVNGEIEDGKTIALLLKVDKLRKMSRRDWGMK
ncbi:MAG: NUDIX hydrolase [Ruminococcaceae bacterium]|nr:NUDIX hydrolase [Oscillospiraceae bacterium]